MSGRDLDPRALARRIDRAVTEFEFLLRDIQTADSVDGIPNDDFAGSEGDIKLEKILKCLRLANEATRMASEECGDWLPAPITQPIEVEPPFMNGNGYSPERKRMYSDETSEE